MSDELEERLRQVFKNNSDCYADTWHSENGFMEEGEVVQAMTEDKFIEVHKSIHFLRNTAKNTKTPEHLELLEALKLGIAAIGDHYVPQDCYSTGPLTGTLNDHLCPACAFLKRARPLIDKEEAT
jgi:hypothetical protein